MTKTNGKIKLMFKRNWVMGLVLQYLKMKLIFSVKRNEQAILKSPSAFSPFVILET